MCLDSFMWLILGLSHLGTGGEDNDPLCPAALPSSTKLCLCGVCVREVVRVAVERLWPNNMTQSVQVNQKLPDLGAPFLYSTQSQGDQGGSYSVQTPYGFQLDLDFLKYVEEIESGHNFRRVVVNARRGSRSTKTSQRSPGAGGRTSGWTSTESLSSLTSEDGRVPPPPPPRNRTTSAPSETHPLSPLPMLSPPLSAGLKVPPIPLIRNPRVERTLLETSRRLQQEQTQFQNDMGFHFADPPRSSSASSPTKETQLLTVPSLSLCPSQINCARASPHTSGRSTPAQGSSSTIGLAPVPSGQLQTVREQMAAALRQLKEMEEKMKGVPALEKEVAQLRAEKERLLTALREKTAAEGSAVLQRSQTKGNSRKEEEMVLDDQGCLLTSPVHGKTRKLVELRKLTEKLGGKDDKEDEHSERMSTIEKVTRVKKAVAVGDDRPLEESVFYYCQGKKEVAVATSLVLCDKGVGTDSKAMCEEGVDAKPETEEASVWVMESLLGLKSEAEKKIDTLQDTIKLQHESIEVLESRLNQADNELEALKAEELRRKSIVMMERGVLVKPQMTTTGVETETSNMKMEKQSVGVGCSCEVMDAHVGPDFTSCQKHQSTQTDLEKSAKGTTLVVVTNTASQWDNPCEEDRRTSNEKYVAAALKRRQMTVTEGTITPAEVSVTKTHQDLEAETVPCSPAVGTLKSIMKKKDESGGPCEPRSGNKKSLQFVGILNGGYESTSSEDEGEEGDSSSVESGDGGSSDSSEDGNEALEDTSDDERNINLDDSDSDVEELRGAKIKDAEEPQTVKEKFELSTKMREACLLLKNHLNDDVSTLKSKEVLSSTHNVQMEWFRVSSAKTAQPSRVSDYLMAFSEVSPALLAHVVNMTDGNGNSALHYSVSHSNFAVVGLLLDTAVCSVDQQNKAGYTAIMLAALAAVTEEEDMKVVRKLFSQGNVNAKASQAGQTALMLAVSHGRQEMVRMLLACGANVNVQDDEGSTALMCACEHGRAEIVSLLLEQPDCDISIVDNDGSNALSIALEASHKDIAVLLYAHMNYSKTQAANTSKPHPRSPSAAGKTWPAE
ncbi:KN motif and ankyrin repeat domain-containing protein 3 isoform X1 [Arapaima gigas]